MNAVEATLDLVNRAKSGDPVATEQIVRDYKGLVRSLANKFYLVGGDKEDLLQEGMLGVIVAINSYDKQKGAFPAFVKLCVSRQIVDAVRRDAGQKNKPLANYIDINTLQNVSGNDSPLADLLDREYAAKVAQCMRDTLTPSERQVITLFADGYRYDDICRITGKSYKAVDGALQRGRKKLAQALDDN